MRVLDLKLDEVAQLLRKQGLRIQIGPFAVNLRSPLNRLAEPITSLYNYYPRLDDASFADFHIIIKKPVGLRHWVRPQAVFSFDGIVPFKPLPEDQAFAMFEWGLNWCIATTSHQYLIIHAAVIAKNDKAIILPGAPGAGKSTLCAALVSQGWRLLSDEMALINADDLRITPVPRPISLKNESIDIMRKFDGDAVIGPSVTDTVKGTVAHLRPPTDSVVHADRHATPAYIIFPAYAAESKTELKSVERGRGLARLAEQSFNYHILGADGFRALEKLVSRFPVYDLNYSQLATAIAEIDTLVP